jgi:hypothetical protein
MKGAFGTIEAAFTDLHGAFADVETAPVIVRDEAAGSAGARP